MFIIAFLTVVGNESITIQMVSVPKLEFVSGIKIMALIPNIQQQDGFGPFEYQTSSLFSFPAFIDLSVSLASFILLATVMQVQVKESFFMGNLCHQFLSISY